MTVMKVQFAFSCLSALLFASCNSYTSDITMTIEQPVIPVLAKKDASATIKLIIVRTDTLPYTIDGIRLGLEGTTDLQDIESVGLYLPAAKDRINTSASLCDPVPVAGQVTLRGPIEVTSDTMSLWVAVSLRDTVDLTHKVAISCLGLETSRGRVAVPDTESLPLRVGVAVRQGMQDDVHTSRIPSLTTTGDGTLLALFDARRDLARDLQGDIDICMHRSTDGGLTWGPMQTVLDMGEWGGLPEKFNGVSDAGVVVDKHTGEIFALGLWMHGVLDDRGQWIEHLTDTSTVWNHQWRNHGSQSGFGVKQSSQLLLTSSTDDGATWSEPRNLTAELKRPEWWLLSSSSGHGVTLADGTLVLPTQGRDATGESFSNITWSKDHGKTWHTSAPAFYNTTECNAVDLPDGGVMLNMRDNRNRGVQSPNGRRIRVTHDLGQTWIEHPTSYKALVEPTCMASIHRHRYTENGEQKSILLFSNPSNFDRRDHMTLKVSFDEGMTWPEEYWILYDEYRSAGYSSITSVDPETIGIFYETSQSHLAFLRISLDEILKRK